jgi:hypothetical protein
MQRVPPEAGALQRAGAELVPGKGATISENGDHAVNIGERVLYMVTGWLPEKTGSARQRLREAEAGTGPGHEQADEPPDDPADGAEG